MLFRSGDGSLQMNIQELQTIRYNNMNIIIFILNNDGYHSIRQTQSSFFGLPLVGVNRESGVGFPNLNKIADAYEMPYYRLEMCIRDSNIGLRVNDREWKLIQRKVRLSGLTLREFFLRCVCGKDIIVKPGGREVVVELKRLGNNLNQLTYLANAGRIYDCAQELQHIYAEVREVRRAWQ